MNQSSKPATIDASYDKKNFTKFILFSIIGLIMFLIPVKDADGSYTVVTGLMANYVQAALGDILLYIGVFFVVLCAVVQPICSILKPEAVKKSKFLSGLFIVSPVYWVSAILGAVVCIMCVTGKGPEFVIGEATGQTMIGIMCPLVGIIMCVVFFMPFLTDYGLMEFIGIFLRKIVKKLFTVPGRSAIDLIASWLSASNAAVILTSDQYSKGYYSKREAATIITAFSAINIPFCLVVAVALDVQKYFPQMYLTLCLCGIACALITPRIWPLCKFPDEYNPATGKQTSELVPDGVKASTWACKLAADKAATFDIKDVIISGLKMMLTVYVSTLAIVMAWGTIALIITEYTPVFNWISLPFGYFFKVLGVEYAFEAAPAAISGFIDMYIPTMMVLNIPSMVTRWIIGTLSLAQIIFMTEVGILAMQAKVGLNVWNMFIIFLERTIISIPVIVLMANILL